MAKGAVRTLGRRLALQFLFGIDYMGESLQDALVEFWRADPIDLTLQNCEQGEQDQDHRAFAPVVEEEARQYADTLIGGVYQHLASLDREISQALDHWKPERVGRIEWAILRIGLYEIRHVPEVPVPVVIDEAQNLADCFGDPDTPRFVSGVLNRLCDHPPADPAIGE